MSDKRNLNAGCLILTIGYLALAFVSFIMAEDLKIDTRQGRHLLAGALANLSFSFAQIMITNFALRKAEKWAWWSNLVPLIIYGLIILIIDATHVRSQNLVRTLAPQVAGLLILVTGLIISGMGIYKRSNLRSENDLKIGSDSISKTGHGEPQS